ncbi:hypothetical protein SEN777SA01_41710 [Salmonella enterica subsp. enterica serovar Agona]|nr:hypothetical protein SE451239_22693 [Salmonella enterica subsp. enterica serovar 4 [Salmonella enterica subsp. enterica serovar 4 [Salmonella enterica subsp. enterica serovar 4,[5],12:i:- str. 08-1739]EYR74457.1 hypothetical protein I654_15350 [Salmonella enterica subsp. enterica serovar Aqua str. NVSL2001]CAH2825206.1 hypothetical protein SENB94_40650 [Salmonella enterica subsp. enterica serovar Virchow]CAH2825962.1 hypothetical protein SENBN720500_42980 [Salmonella enterica subsp. enterica]
MWLGFSLTNLLNLKGLVEIQVFLVEIETNMEVIWLVYIRI